MGGRGRQKGDFYYRKQQGTRSQNRKAPIGKWQPTVPSWEKKFCSFVGSFSWPEFLEMKKYTFLYENVMQWDDSAGEEAFLNAKRRFWAQINNMPCDISLPDPDIYIDKVDWDSDVDPELLLDLEAEMKGQHERVEDKASAVDLSFLLNRPVPCTGWGDEEDDKTKAVVLFSDVKFGEFDQSVDNSRNSWEPNSGHRSTGHMEDSNWGNGWTDSWKWNQETNHNDWKQNYGVTNKLGGMTCGDWSTRNANGLQERGPGCSMPRYRTRRFRGNDYQENQQGLGYRRRRKKGYYTHGQSFQDSKPSSRRWALQ